jgi:hypothetical protein
MRALVVTSPASGELCGGFVCFTYVFDFIKMESRQVDVARRDFFAGRKGINRTDRSLIG